MPDTRIQQSQDQTLQQRLSPQMRQSLEILQAPALELQQLLRQELETNPTLEDDSESLSLEAEEERIDAEDAELERIAEFDDDYREEMILAGRTLGRNREQEERREHLYDSLQVPPTLQEHIARQMQGTEVRPEVAQAMDVLTGSLDERGFLATDPEELALTFGLRLEDLEEARRLLASFDPLGLGARNFQECLLIQLDAAGKGDSLAARIVRDHLDALARNKRPEIAKALGVSVPEVNHAAEVIASLDPNPAREFSEDTNRLVRPDLRFFTDSDGQWKVDLIQDHIPRLRISNAYKDMLSDMDTPKEARTYIRNKIHGGRFIIQCIEQRQDTLRRIAEVIADRQRDFLERGPLHLAPLTMQQVAEKVGVHETTVSRAVAGKYAETPRGIVEMRKFFTAGYQTKSGKNLANTSVKERLAAFIAEENPSKPLSDDAIVKTLKKKGIKISRRTIAKYRQALNIPPSHLRRRHD